ncbi:MAG: DcaP family trimeric outer membrane transporter [Stagnimonas sp.]|nr:DcaP family trimeric outer membrane transporter [Stagnimonas sp.]
MASVRFAASAYTVAARALCASALLLPLAPLAQAAPDAETTAVIRELRQRLDALEAQLAAERAARSAAPAVTAAAPPVPAKAGEAKLGDTKLTWGGYVKADAMYSRFSEGEVAQGSGRDFYLPNSIPVSAGGGDSREFFDAHAKETRLFLKTETALDGHKLGTHIEFDFIVSQGAGTEVVTNAYNPGLRRAFVTYDNWLLGQEWSTFQNLGALPETLDFVAFPSEGTVFVRQPQVRYTRGGLQLALENPETSVLPGGGGAVAGDGDSSIPDAIARYNFKLGATELTLAGLLRQLRVENPAAGAAAAVKDSRTGGGLSFSGRIPLGKDDLKFMLTSGDGIGRYVALGTSADAVLSAGELDSIGITAGYLAYKHQWSPQWRSTLTASAFEADNDIALTGGAVTKSVRSYSGNLLYSPVAKLTFGVEYRHASREVVSGADGDLDRLQFSTKYSF